MLMVGWCVLTGAFWYPFFHSFVGYRSIIEFRGRGGGGVGCGGERGGFTGGFLLPIFN